MSTSFNDYNLAPNIVNGLEKQGITEPTKIQHLVIPQALKNKDIIGESHTGTGKTLAFLIPIFMKVDVTKREAQAIIIAPTHELVMQIEAQIRLLAENSGMPITSITLIGEASMEKQIKKLKDTKPHIIVGTRGRIMDLITQRKLKSHTVKTIVIDEADNLLDPANVEGVKSIIKTTLKDRQLMAFSATVNDRTLNIARELMKDPQVFVVDEKIIMNPNIEHMYIIGDKRDKFELLRKVIVASETAQAIVFVNKGQEIEFVTEKLNYHSKNAAGIYGTLSKEDRKRAMNDFRSGKLQVLVSSDLSARGLDFPDVTHIFNLDFPRDADEYLHRAGRTARGNASGTCISIITEAELAAIRVYEREFNISFKHITVYDGKLYLADSKQK
jgi:ATP-dependent RNA helicase DeaD